MRKLINLKDATTKEILAFSLLPFGMYTFLSIMTTSLNFYLTDVLKLTPLLVGFVLFGTKFWDAINDPMMGAIVERTRNKNGKCRPYLLWMTLPLVLCTILLYLPIAEMPYFQRGMATTDGTAGEYRRFIYVFIMYSLFYVAYTGIEIPFNGLAPLVFPENEKRVKAISWSNIVGSIGTVLPSILFFVFVDIWKDQKSYGSFLGAVIFSIMGGVFIYWSFFGIKEKIYLPPKKAEFKKMSENRLR
jgi:Na+/melibiose symporter and related transporters